MDGLQSGRPPAIIETYTTEITYALDLGIIAPLCIIAVVLLRKRNPMAYLLLATLLLLCVVVGIMLPVQALFQAQASIWLPLPVLVTKVVSFCVLATFASYFLWCLVKDIDGSKPVH